MQKESSLDEKNNILGLVSIYFIKKGENIDDFIYGDYRITYFTFIFMF